MRHMSVFFYMLNMLVISLFAKNFGGFLYANNVGVFFICETFFCFFLHAKHFVHVFLCNFHV